MQITDNRFQLLNICTDSVFKTLFKYPQIVLFLRDNDHLIDGCAPFVKTFFLLHFITLVRNLKAIYPLPTAVFHYVA